MNLSKRKSSLTTATRTGVNHTISYQSAPPRDSPALLRFQSTSTCHCICWIFQASKSSKFKHTQQPHLGYAPMHLTPKLPHRLDGGSIAAQGAFMPRLGRRFGGPKHPEKRSTETKHPKRTIIIIIIILHPQSSRFSFILDHCIQFYA